MAAILAIGNIEFKNRNEQATIADDFWLHEAARSKYSLILPTPYSLYSIQTVIS